MKAASHRLNHVGEPAGLEPNKKPLAAGGGQGFEESTGDETSSRVVYQSLPSEKAYATVAARLAIQGHEMEMHHHPQGLTLFEVGKHGQWRVYSHSNDVTARFAQLGG